MNILNDIIGLGNSDIVSGLSNLVQLADFGSDLADLSNGQQLQKIVKEFDYQNKQHLEVLLKYIERLILESSKNLENQKIIIKQNDKIISLLSGVVK